ncbi:hypothetical protein [Litoribacillus peritrichatus]|uniref:Uncharacterized protein n=1 Tax=Litoribacillus peritrichatus TaxID=718191 RepID=A0ABP7MV11_9GAMM
MIVDPDKNIVYLAEMKSSQNGVDVARDPNGPSPRARLEDWVRKSKGPWGDNQPGENLHLSKQIQKVLASGGEVRGIWIKVEVPRINEGSGGTLQMVLKNYE